jgi:hypothetical protein
MLASVDWLNKLIFLNVWSGEKKRNMNIHKHLFHQIGFSARTLLRIALRSPEAILLVA